MPTGIFASPHDWGTESKNALAGRIDRTAAELAPLLRGGGTGRQRGEKFDMFSESMIAASKP